MLKIKVEGLRLLHFLLWQGQKKMRRAHGTAALWLVQAEFELSRKRQR